VDNNDISRARQSRSVATPDHKTIHVDCNLLHRIAGAAAKVSNISGGVLVLCAYGEGGGPPKAERFEIGDAEGMSRRAYAWSTEHDQNVYRGLAIVRTGLRGNERGGLHDILGVIGACADLDGDKGCKFRIEDLPLPPSRVIITSHVPVQNLQATYFFTRALSVEEAQPIAWALCRLVGDKDGGTADVAHVWRPAGTLNYPKPGKLRRARPDRPQLVTVGEGGTGRAVEPEELVGALEVALEDRLGGKPPAEAYRTEKQGGSGPSKTSVPARRDGPYWSGDHFDGNPQELGRLVDALAHTPADDRRVWREVTCGLCDFFMGSALGKQVADTWAGGGTFMGITFVGCPTKYDPAAQDLLWREAIGRAEFTIATVFHYAKKLGKWNTSRARWGLGRVQRPQQDLKVAARGVQTAGLNMPRQHMNLERLAWYYQVLLGTKRPDLRDVAFVIAGFINAGSGIAFPKFETISKALRWEPGDDRVGFQRASRAVRDLALLGYIVRSPGNECGAHGRIGPSFALTLPDGMAWQEAIDAYRVIFRSSDLASTSIGRCESEPNSVPATSMDQCRSVPNGAVLEQHQTMPVQTAHGDNQHQPMRLHLSTNKAQEERGRKLEGLQWPATPVASAANPSTTSEPAKARASDRHPRQTQKPEAASIHAETVDAAYGWTAENFWDSAKPSTEAGHG
jgi:hypothetical protein